MKKKAIVLPLTLILADYVLVATSFILSYRFRDYINNAQLIGFAQFVVFALIAAFLYVLLYAYLGLYSIKRSKDLVDQLFAITIGSVAASTIAGAGIYFGKYFDYSRLIIGLGLLMSIVLVWLGRVVVRGVERYLYARGVWISNILIVGSGSLSEMAVKGILAERGSGYRIVGLIGVNERVASSEVVTLGLLEEVDIRKVIEDNDVTEVMVTESLTNERVLEFIAQCESLGIDFKFIPDIYDTAMVKAATDDLAGMPVIELKPTTLQGWMIIAKRVMDVFLSIVGLVVLSPLLLLTAILIKRDSKGPVFFVHQRVGRYGQQFGLVKFRSMSMVEKDGELLHANENTEVEKIKEQQANYKLEHDPRVTKVGRFIRKMSIDELPQLINVLRGELSIVGPRAYLLKELETQQDRHPDTRGLVRRLLTVKPGITGLWQISGRSNINFTERVAMDAYYASNANIWMDLKIILQTFPVVIKGSGAM
ncbi:sugar transferase [candidate division WWE3 bacterium]|uniref:Sugar transferase n=1 Tax=candidate division WWE3 bacterium TaxID=2053526 RepID=A0A955RSH6_UNCKA|nr:sugar transferase [candidate division WWE3 bacterium]